MTQTTQKPSVVSQSPESAEITVYLGGPALIREQRTITLPEGKSVVTLSGLPENLVPNSLTVTKTQGESGKLTLGPLSYRPANLSLQAILSKAEGSVITVIDRADAMSERSVTGKLLHIIGNSLVLQVADKVEVLPSVSAIGSTPPLWPTSPSLHRCRWNRASARPAPSTWASCMPPRAWDGIDASKFSTTPLAK